MMLMSMSNNLVVARRVATPRRDEVMSWRPQYGPVGRGLEGQGFRPWRGSKGQRPVVRFQGQSP